MNELTAAIPSHLTNFAPEATKSKNVLGKDDFMKLMMTQLRYQDPVNPMNHQEFAAQLAQFSQLEQLSGIGSGIQNLRQGLGEGSKLQALGMIGKNVQATGNEVELVEGRPVTFQYASVPDVKPVKVSIYDGGGKLVREMDIAKQIDGSKVEWDGQTTDGMAVEPGKYSFRVYGVGKDGQSKEISSSQEGRVVGVEMDGANPVLIVDSNGRESKMELAKVKHVGLDKGAPAAAPVGVPADLAKAKLELKPEEKKESETDSEPVAENAWRRNPYAGMLGEER